MQPGAPLPVVHQKLFFCLERLFLASVWVQHLLLAIANHLQLIWPFCSFACKAVKPSRSSPAPHWPFPPQVALQRADKELWSWKNEEAAISCQRLFIRVCVSCHEEDAAFCFAAWKLCSSKQTAKLQPAKVSARREVYFFLICSSDQI